MTASLPSLPLLPHADPQAPFAWRDGVAISVREFLADAEAQAEALPSHGSMVNLCVDRYRFAVAFAAALMRGHTSLLPPDALPQTLAQLRLATPEAADHAIYALTDASSLHVEGMPLLRSVPDASSARAGAHRGALSGAHPRASTSARQTPHVAPCLTAAVLLTSGSTGVPSPHAKSFGELAANIASASVRLCELLERTSLAGLNIVATVPPQHSYGFESSVLLAMLGQAAIDSGRPYYPADIAETLARLPRPRALVTTPFHLKALLASDVPLPPVDLVLSATAPLSVQLAQQAEAVFGGSLVEIYGCTEAGQLATRRPTCGSTWHTFDGLQISRLQASSADESTEDLRYIVQGGRLTEPVPLADALDLEGASHFHLLGRANDLIHVAGRRSSLAHLDHHLNSIEGVIDGAFWVPPDVADGVVRPVAFVVAPSLTTAQIGQALRSRLEAVFVPRRIVHVSSLPREATGKLTRRALAELAAAHPAGTA